MSVFKFKSYLVTIFSSDALNYIIIFTKKIHMYTISVAKMI